MTNKAGRHIDKTYLSIDNAETRGFIHRDYIAHCLRWSHFIKCIAKGSAYKAARVLDIGCGKETPLAKLLYSSKMFPEFYRGVDIGKIDLPKLGKYQRQAEFHRYTDIAEVDISVDYWSFKYDFIVCFEVLEHVEPAHCIKILKKIHDLLTPDGTAFISTPCWDEVHTAGNHVNEMRYEVISALIERHGFSIDSVYGTFASIKDYRHKLDNAVGDWRRQEGEDPMMHNPSNRTLAVKILFDELRDYYDTNFLACLFAPIFPQYSRNCLWKIIKKRKDYIDCFGLARCKQPWSSSELWRELDQ